ncbi:MAG: hypothetical protein K6F53_09705, partial [Lachnospiraceae bacterium]|nr:hypothetical protein [Lachnospiraceae bacterium]
GYQGSAAIGGGYFSDCGTVIINGGEVTARNNYTGYTGAAIGGGETGSGGSIFINGGTVSAESFWGAAIGGGGVISGSAWQPGNGGTVNISGGKITAHSREGYGIGPGTEIADRDNTGDPGTITLNSNDRNDSYDILPVKAAECFIQNDFRYMRDNADMGPVTPENIFGKTAGTIILPVDMHDLASCRIENGSRLYPYTGNVTAVSLRVVTPEGRLLKEDVDYTLSLSPETVKEKGVYTVTLTGQGLYGGSSLSGKIIVEDVTEGTPSDPVIIKEAAYWDIYSAFVNDGSWSDMCFALSDDFDNENEPVTASYGTAEHPFTGVFDGKGKDLYTEISDTEAPGTAPFRYIEGATLRELNVKGSVTGGTCAGGLAGYVLGSGNLIESCIVGTSVFVPGKDREGTVGGVVGNVGNSGLTINDTVFNGTIGNERNLMGGLIGFCTEGAVIRMRNCLFDGRASAGAERLHPTGIREYNARITATLTDVFHTLDNGYSQKAYIIPGGVHAYREDEIGDLSGEKIFRGFIAADHEPGYEEVTLAGPESAYVYREEPLKVNPSLISASGKVLSLGTDYREKLIDQEGNETGSEKDEAGAVILKDAGEYTVCFEGIGECRGSTVRNISIAKADVNDPVIRLSIGCGGNKAADLSSKIMEGGKAGELTVTGNPDGVLKEAVLEGNRLSVSVSDDEALLRKSALLSIPVTDARNHNDYQIIVKVTMVECEHLHTEIRNRKVPDCITKGYTGDIYCTDCHKVIREGSLIAKDPSNHVADRDYQTVYAPSSATLGIGIRKAFCICGHSFGYEAFTEEGGKADPDAIRQLSSDAGSDSDSISVKSTEEQDEEGKTVTITEILVNNKTVQTLRTHENGETTLETKLWIGGIRDAYSFTGSAIRPVPHIYDGMKLLRAGRDYTVSYKNNKNISNDRKKNGLASMTLKFRGDYKSTPKMTIKFRVVPAVLGNNGEEGVNAKASDLLIAASGKTMKPACAVTYTESGKSIDKKNFRFTYEDEQGKALTGIKTPGIYKVTVTPKNGSFTGCSWAFITVVAKADGNKLL